MTRKPKVKVIAAPEQEPELTVEEKARKRRPVGIYLRVKTREEVERIAAANSITLHALCAYAIADFVRRHKAGRAIIQTTKKTVLKMDV